jgi:hypothetical protein
MINSFKKKDICTGLGGSAFTAMVTGVFLVPIWSSSLLRIMSRSFVIAQSGFHRLEVLQHLAAASTSAVPLLPLQLASLLRYS